MSPWPSSISSAITFHWFSVKGKKRTSEQRKTRPNKAKKKKRPGKKTTKHKRAQKNTKTNHKQGHPNKKPKVIIHSV